MARKQLIVPIFIPHQGCPYRCVFCNQTEISGQDKKADREKVLKPLQTYLKTHPLDQLPEYREAAFYGGTFTGLPIERQKFLLSLLQPWLEDGSIHAIRVSTHSLFIDSEKLKLLRMNGVKTIELGVQSTDPEVLKLAGRDTPIEVLSKSANMIRTNGFKLGLQLMPGLPGDSVNKFLKSVDDVLDMKPDFVRLYPSLVIRNTALHDMYKNGEYRPWDLVKTLEALTIAVKKFSKAKVAVIRVGLHPEPSLLESYVDGPIHPSMRYLVDCRISLDKMVETLSKQVKLPNKVLFKVPSKQVSTYTGHKKENIIKLKNLFSLDEVSVQEGNDDCELELVT
jgi:histone acetyltransferase (RNA polymerase elongator complex component)